MGHGEHKKCERSTFFISLSAVFVAVAAHMVFAVVYSKQLNTKSMSTTHKWQHLESCKDCYRVFLMSRMFQDKVAIDQRYLNSDLSCCNVSFEDTKQITNMTLQRKRKDLEVSKKLKKTAPVSVHKYLLPSNQAMNFSNVDHMTVALDIESNAYNSPNHDRGVKIRHDGIEIVYSGLYFVYSSLFYEPNTNVSSEHFPYQTWFHYVYRTRPCSPAMSSVILRTVFTCCPNCAHGKDSVYTGGIFHLKSGDIIQVCLSGQGIMGKDTVKDSSFLGLYMLASG